MDDREERWLLYYVGSLAEIVELAWQEPDVVEAYLTRAEVGLALEGVGMGISLVSVLG